MFAFGGGVFARFGGGGEAGEGFAGFVRLAMFGGEAVFIDGGDVGASAVADVLVKTVVGVFGA